MAWTTLNTDGVWQTGSALKHRGPGGGRLRDGGLYSAEEVALVASDATGVDASLSLITLSATGV